MSERSELPFFGNTKILVVGELVLDKYLWGTVDRISPEAPVPVIRIRQREARPGNAAFVCASLRSLGASVSLVSVTGADDEGRSLKEIIRSLGVSDQDIVDDASRPTVVKQRLLGSVQAALRGTQQLLRLDEEDPRPLDSEVEESVIDRLMRQIPLADGVLVCDINKGLLTSGVLSALTSRARQCGVPVIVDPRLCDDLSIYRSATALTPNRYEAERATGVRLTHRADWEIAGRSILRDLDLNFCLITLDREGMFLCQRDGGCTHLATKPQEVFDVTGAGDVALSVFGLCLIAGVEAASAGAIANVAAGLEVEKQGTSIISREELAFALEPTEGGAGGKIVSCEDLGRRLTRHRNAGHKVSFAHGAFEALYSEDIRMLQFARSQGDILVVGISSNEFGETRNGTARAADGARLLAALQAVDYVTICDGAPVEAVIKVINPDVIVKRTAGGGEASDWDSSFDGPRYVCENANHLRERQMPR